MMFKGKQTEYALSALLVAQIVLGTYVWMINPVHARTQSISSLIWAASLITFSLVAYIFRAASDGTPPRNLWVASRAAAAALLLGLAVIL